MTKAIATIGALAATAALPLAIAAAIGGAIGGQPPIGTRPGGTGTVLRTNAGIPPADAALYNTAAGTCPLVTAPVLAAQGYTESSFNPTAVSRAANGTPIAYGIAQFTPQTWAQYGGGLPLSAAFIPADAIPAQAKYDCTLALAVAAVTGDALSLTLAAYNAGPYAVIDAHGIPNDPGVHAYVAAIETLASKYGATEATPGQPNPSFVAAEMTAAEAQLGLPYIWGGGDYSGPTAGGFDCSGLVMFAIYQASAGAIRLDHDSNAQARGLDAIGGQKVGTVIAQGIGSSIDLDSIAVGDAIGFQIDHGPDAYDHIGIYVGNGDIIHASHPGPGGGVKLESLNEPYFQGIQWSVVRFAPATPLPTTTPTTSAKPIK